MLTNVSISFESLQERISRPDQIGEATDYIKNLQIKLEKMKEKKSNLTDIERSRNDSMNMGVKSSQFKIQQMGSTLEVVLVTGLDCQFIFNETIRILQEEGSDIVNASYTVVENAVFHTIHCQVSYEFSITPLPYSKIVFSTQSFIIFKIELTFKLTKEFFCKNTI